MSKERATRKASSSGGRGSAEAIEKRRVARQLNTLFSGGAKRGSKLDGRTEKRRQRLLKELKEGRRGEPLKAIEIVMHTNQLLEIGETLSSIRKNGVKMPKVPITNEAIDVVERAQAAYNFKPDAWKILGVEVEPADLDGGKKKKGKRGKKARRMAEANA